ncbi:MAG: hypothetical protein M3O71_31950 [Bacteroidota bacterium]|nr:hypothetical protein [Bacteroidota bacterium]
MKKAKNIFWLLLPVVIIGYFIYKVAMNSFTSHFLGSKPQVVKAIAIDEKNFMGNQPVDPKFSYSYSFEVDGKQYKGNSHDTTLRVGDTIEVEYNKDHPSINKPLHPQN